VGEYFRNSIINMAEVAYSVSRDFQGMGIANILQRKLAKAAKDNGINGLVAYTSPENRKMIKLFQKLPYKVIHEKDDDMVILSCKFDEPLEADKVPKR
jgi:RimJ/RimL family protein N-acetyltransferase